MSEIGKQYLQALTQYVQNGRSDSLPPAILLGMLRDYQPEDILMLHGQTMNVIDSVVEPEEALQYYRLSYVFLMELMVHGRFRFQYTDNRERMVEELRNMLFKNFNEFQLIRNKYENMLQHMDAGIILFESAGFVSFVNLQMARFLGISRKSLIGCSLPNLMSHPGLSKSFRKLISRLYREMFQYRLRYHEVIDEHGRHYLITATYGDELEGDILISVKDITEFKRIEQSAYQNDKLALLGKIAASIAHEIRNPLTSIRGFMQLLRPYLNELGKEEYAKIILDEIDRANHIIFEFLNSSKPSTPDKKDVQVSALLKEISLLFESEALLKGCDIELVSIDPSLTLCADSKQIKQALLNIVKNSLDAVGHASYLRKGSIRISAERHDGDVLISIRDNGTGMDQHTLSRLFDPFFTTKLDGTGLGMAVCYRIIKNHGGTIRVDSSVGEGTTFQILLPSG